jgi:hypothetical protein
MEIAGHVSRQMLARYSHIRMEGKRVALEGLVIRSANGSSPSAAIRNPANESQRVGDRPTQA